MGQSRNTVSDKTWKKVKDADGDRHLRDFGKASEVSRQRNYSGNRANPRSS